MRKKEPNWTFHSEKIKIERRLRIPKLRRETNYGSFSYHSPCYLRVKEGEGLPVTSPEAGAPKTAGSPAKAKFRRSDIHLPYDPTVASPIRHASEPFLLRPAIAGSPVTQRLVSTPLPEASTIVSSRAQQLTPQLPYSVSGAHMYPHMAGKLLNLASEQFVNKAIPAAQGFVKKAIPASKEFLTNAIPASQGFLTDAVTTFNTNIKLARSEEIANGLTITGPGMYPYMAHQLANLAIPVGKEIINKTLPLIVERGEQLANLAIPVGKEIINKTLPLIVEGGERLANVLIPLGQTLINKTVPPIVESYNQLPLSPEARLTVERAIRGSQLLLTDSAQASVVLEVATAAVVSGLAGTAVKDLLLEANKAIFNPVNKTALVAGATKALLNASPASKVPSTVIDLLTTVAGITTTALVGNAFVKEAKEYATRQEKIQPPSLATPVESFPSLTGSYSASRNPNQAQNLFSHPLSSHPLSSLDNSGVQPRARKRLTSQSDPSTVVPEAIDRNAGLLPRKKSNETIEYSPTRESPNPIPRKRSKTTDDNTPSVGVGPTNDSNSSPPGNSTMSQNVVEFQIGNSQLELNNNAPSAYGDIYAPSPYIESVGSTLKGYWKTYQETMPDITVECASEVVITGVDSEDPDPKDLAQACLIVTVIGLFIGNKLYYACKKFLLGRK